MSEQKYVPIEEIADFMRDKGVSPESALASLSMTVVNIAMNMGVSKENMLNAMGMTYDMLKAKQEDETCH